MATCSKWTLGELAPKVYKKNYCSANFNFLKSEFVIGCSGCYHCVGCCHCDGYCHCSGFCVGCCVSFYIGQFSNFVTV